MTAALRPPWRTAKKEAIFNMEILRFITAGSVDDGKSTLIGRLLYDSKALARDLIEAIEASSRRSGSERVNLALLTDGLRAEREQGITIDVAYRYFTTGRRKFIIADTPGHIQYTRNMVTGASTADLAIILVDARTGIVEQTRRHTYIANLLGIQYIILAVNKMDLIDFSEERFCEIEREYRRFTDNMNFCEIICIPLAAIDGDNVVERSMRTPWYSGFTLLQVLENVDVRKDRNYTLPRFPVQWVIRPQSNEYHDFRGYAGTVASGIFSRGDEVVALPSHRRSRITKILKYDREVLHAPAGHAVTILLEDDIDIGRGDMLVHPESAPTQEKEIHADICWMSSEPLLEGQKLFLRHTTREVRAIVQSIVDRVNIHTLNRENARQLELNDIGRIKIRLSEPIFTDPYAINRSTGSFILIAQDNATVAAGMITSDAGEAGYTI